MMPFTTMNRKGFALSIVMWIVAALLLGIALVLILSKETLALTHGVQDKLKARLEAEDYLEAVKYYLLTANYDSRKLMNTLFIEGYHLPREIVLDGREYNITKRVTLSMQDASSLLNLFYPDASLIASFANHGDMRVYHIIKDSIEDWVDADNMAKLHGAEKHDGYQPRNYPAVQSIDELRIINGIDTLPLAQFTQLKSYINPSCKGTSVNLALIDRLYLSKLLHIEQEKATVMIDYRESSFQKFLTLITKNPLFDEGWMGFALSFIIYIKIHVSVGSAVVHLETVIDFKAEQSHPITIEYYRIY